MKYAKPETSTNQIGVKKCANSIEFLSGLNFLRKLEPKYELVKRTSLHQSGVVVYLDQPTNNRVLYVCTDKTG